MKRPRNKIEKRAVRCFAAGILLGLPIIANATHQVASGDFNGDGIPDLAIIPSGGGPLTLWVGDSKGVDNGGWNPITKQEIVGEATSKPTCMDLNEDGFDDIVLNRFSRNEILIAWGQDNLTSPLDFESFESTPGPQLVTPFQELDSNTRGFASLLSAQSRPTLQLTRTRDGRAIGETVLFNTTEGHSPLTLASLLPTGESDLTNTNYLFSSYSESKTGSTAIGTIWSIKASSSTLPSITRFSNVTLKRGYTTALPLYPLGYNNEGYFVTFDYGADPMLLTFIPINPANIAPETVDEVTVSFPQSSAPLPLPNPPPSPTPTPYPTISTLKKDKTDLLLIGSPDGVSAKIIQYSPPGKYIEIDSFDAPADQAFSHLLALESGQIFSAFISDTPDSPIAYSVYSDSGSGFEITYSDSSPAPSTSSSPTTVVLFNNDFFGIESSLATETFAIGDWTTAADFDGSTIKVNAETKGDPNEGLGEATIETLIPQSNPGINAFALGNQWENDSSLHFASFQAMTDGVAAVSLSPASGTYPLTIAASFARGPNTSVFYSLNDGPWSQATSPLFITGDSTLEYYAKHTSGVTSGIYAASYTIDQSLSQDTDGDWVPDAIEALAGSNPFKQDSDKSGLSDLIEILNGSDPADNTSEIETENPIFNYERIDVNVGGGPDNPVIIGSVYDSVDVSPGENVYVGDLLTASNQLVLDQSPVIAAGTQRIAPIDLDYPLPLLKAWTTAGTKVDLSDSRSSPSLPPMSAIFAPTISSPPSVPFNSEAGDSLAEWIALFDDTLEENAKRDQFAINATSTLAALLIERWIGERLLERGQIDSLDQRPLLANTSPHFQNRISFTKQQKQALEKPDSNNIAWSVSKTVSNINDAVYNSPNLAFARNFVNTIYSQALEAATEESPLSNPLIAIRDWLDTGILKTEYSAQYTQTDLDFIRIQVAELGHSRTAVVVQGNVDTSESGDVKVTTSEFTYKLIKSSGAPYQLTRLGRIVSGTPVSLLGFIDDPRNIESTDNNRYIEVVSALLSRSNILSFKDTDDDYLPDTWEYHFFGNLDTSFDHDSDEDGYTNGEEYHARSNPLSEDSIPSDPLVAPQNYSFTFQKSSGAIIEWTGSAKVTYTIKSSKDLVTFTETGIAPIYLGNNRYRWQSTNPNSESPIFYIIEYQDLK